MIFFCFKANINAATIEWIPDNTWDPAQNAYIIPNDGNIYLISSSNYTLSEHMHVNGTLEVSAARTLDPGLYVIYNNSTININSSAIINLSSGHLFNGITSPGIINITTSGKITSVGIVGNLFNGFAEQGTININGGKIEAISSGRIYNGWDDPGIINVNGAGDLIEGVNGTIYNGNDATGTINLNAGDIKISGGAFHNGYNTQGIININNTSSKINLVAATSPTFRNGDNGAGTINLEGGDIEVNHGIFYNGYNYAGVINANNISSQIRNLGGILYNGGNQAGTVNLAGGDIEVNGGDFRNGLGGLGTVNVNDANSKISVLLGGGVGGFVNGDSTTGIVNLNGGELEVNNGSFYNGNSGTGTVNVNASGSAINILLGTFRNGFSDEGTINVNDGQLNISGGTFNNGMSDYGRVYIYTNGVMNFSSGVFYNGVSYFGQLRIYGGLFDMTGGDFRNGSSYEGNIIMLEGTMRVVGGDFYNGYDNWGTIDLDNDSIVISCVSGNDSFTNNFNYLARINVRRGALYNYGEFKNGRGSGDEGKINIYERGKVFNLGTTAEIVNGDSLSEINVYAGGGLYNYQGDIDLTLGTLTISPGARFDNFRGNNPVPTTLSPGANYSDSDVIVLDRHLYIDCEWKIYGVKKIEGNGHEITFGPNGKLIAQEISAVLTLEDIIFNNVSSDKIKCDSSPGKIIFNNVVLNLDDHYTFGIGRFDVAGDLIVISNNKMFNYTTDQTSNILANGNLHFIHTTFNYNYSQAVNKIQMADSSAILHLEQSKILGTQNFDIDNGTLKVTGLATFEAASGYIDLGGLSDINIAGSITRIGNVYLPVIT